VADRLFIADNPLEFKVDRDRIHLNESLNFTVNTNYPGPIAQLRQKFSLNRTGDLVVFALEVWIMRDSRYFSNNTSQAWA
jgi:hypothetical protein